MKFGIHLPQSGRKAGPDSIQRAARQAEELGWDDVWVNDHLAVPEGAPYPPSAVFYEPIVTLTWAAAATRRVGLGTSVLVLPLRHPVHLAKEVATLDLLSEGRVILGAGIGWLREEFIALGADPTTRGRRTDESIELLRKCWGERTVDHDGRHVPTTMAAMRTLPQPAREVPIWIGGTSEAAVERAIRIGDGWHAVRLSPEEMAPFVTRLRQARPEPEFTISLRHMWDALEDDREDLRRLVEAQAELGVQHMSFEPRQRGIDDWLRAVEAMWRLVEPLR